MKYFILIILTNCFLQAVEPDTLDYNNFYGKDHKMIFYDDNQDDYYDRLETYVDEELSHSTPIEYSSGYTRFAFHAALKDSHYIRDFSRTYCSEKWPSKGYFFVCYLHSSISTIFIYTSCDEWQPTEITSEISIVDSEENSENLSIYPNPVFNSFTLTLGEEINIKNIQNIEIFDNLGNVVSKLPLPASQSYKLEYNVSELINGVYYLKIEYNNYSIYKKMIILH